MMPARNRSRDTYREGGRRWPNNNPVGGMSGPGPVVASRSSISDITGPGDCTPLTINHYEFFGAVINRVNSGAFSYQFRDYVAAAFRNNITTLCPHQSVATEPSAAEMATSAAARTNPSRPVVDVPVNILDLKGGIQKIYHSGRRIIDHVRRNGGRWLNYQFMIKPLVGDIIKMTDINDQINRRIKEIDKLYSSNGIRRTVKNGTFSVSNTNSLVMQSQGTFINMPFDVHTKVFAKTHIRWAPETPCGLRPSPELVRALVTRAAYGATIDLKTLWEIMPWSWLIDWFGNVGTYLAAKRNIIPARIVGVYPMKHRVTTWTGSEYKNGDVTMTRPIAISVQKTRVTQSVSLAAHLPFLSGSQLGILAALAATRA